MKNRSHKGAAFLLAAGMLMSQAAMAEGTTEQVVPEFDPSAVTQLQMIGLPVGDMVEPTKIIKPKQLSEDEAAEMDRSMRAYVPSEGSLYQSVKDTFYYQDLLTGETRDFYDALEIIALDPTNENNIALCPIENEAGSDDFWIDLYVAREALVYDHPEYFWLYNDAEVTLECYIYNDDYVYFTLAEPYARFEERMNAFNAAADAFLADIDTTGTDAEIERQVHDKLINLVTYDDYILENAVYDDLGHTAFGCLVENSRGIANYAVCDGYSQAYAYLLGQLGIEATVVTGMGFPNGLEEGEDPMTSPNGGGHAWSCVKLDGEWYEVDSTWNDAGTLVDAVQTADVDELVKRLYMEALTDESYRAVFEHSLYNVTTAEMTHFVPDENDRSIYFYSKEGYVFSLLSTSDHIRDTEFEERIIGNKLMPLAPVATGTLHAF